ncbi:hypothetical protein K227x_47730 [Rubripirellula lacrimiformis]|uniref:Uncharacterized protein n=1 Tax=Rubripirellula lacrimiformis TaxID=1930273 RepID=A0A517NGW0_9BACT|nr:hypothetical protein K227x_47730 [Rubripirellula lacrimiformis]
MQIAGDLAIQPGHLRVPAFWRSTPAKNGWAARLIRSGIGASDENTLHFQWMDFASYSGLHRMRSLHCKLFIKIFWTCSIFSDHN